MKKLTKEEIKTEADNLIEQFYKGDSSASAFGLGFITGADWAQKQLLKQNPNIAKPNVMCSGYDLSYPKASKFMESADEKLQKIIDKLTDDEWETLRDRFADFYVAVSDHCI
jgi:hypothetical protein